MREQTGHAVTHGEELTRLRVRVAQLERAEKEGEILSRLGMRVAGAASTDDVMRIVWEESERLLGWDCAYLVHRQPGKKTLRSVFFVDTQDGRKKEFSAGHQQTAREYSATFRRALDGEAILINRTPQDPGPAMSTFGTERISASLILVPVRCRDEVTGVLSVQSYTPNRYGQADLQLVQRMADLAAPAVERVYVEDKLRQSESRYRALIEQIPAIAYTAPLDRAAGVIYVSPHIEELLGFSASEYQTEPSLWRERLHPADRDRVLAEVAQCQATETPLLCEYRMVASDGRVVWFRDEAAIVRDEAGHGICLQGVAFDITERKHAEDLLRRQRDLGVALAETTSLSDAMARVLDIALGIDGLDCGGVYVVREATGDLDLIAHRGFSRGLVDAVSRLIVDSVNSFQSRLALGGNPIYLGFEEVSRGHARCAREGMRAIAVMPVKHGGRLTALLNAASRGSDEIPSASRAALEAVVAQIGAAIDRIRSREALQAARDELEHRVAERTAELQVTNESLRKEAADRRQAEETLRVSEERYRTLAEAAKDCIYIIDRDDRVEYINSFGASQFGVRPDEIIGKPRSRLFPPALAARQRLSLDKVFASGEPLAAEGVVSFPHGDTWQHTQLVPLRRADGVVVGVLGISRDITHIKTVTDALCESEERHRTILDQMQEAVIFADSEHVIRDINACACALLGVTREQVVGRDVLAVHGEPMRSRIAEVLHAFREERSRQVVTVRRSLGDREVIFRVSPARGSDSSYRGVIAAIVDITEQVRMQEQLAEAQKLETVGRLAGGIAHDFNNLMQTALGSASRLRARCSPDHPSYATLAQIEQATDTAGRLAHQLLVYAKGGKILPRVVNFAGVVARAVEVFSPAVPAGVLLDCQIADDIGEVECDTTRTEQAIVNLCRNAADAMPEGGRLTICADNATLASALEDAHPSLPAGEYVRVTVEDTGRGVAPEVLPRLFDPFVTTKPNGHGLGLAATYGTVKAHGGGISVETALGVGSTFRIWLPRVQISGTESSGS